MEEAVPLLEGGSAARGSSRDIDPPAQMLNPPEKLGAGFLFCNNRELLLLLRSSKHNDSTWRLPGGNADRGETLEAVALREAVEEMGGLPAGVGKGAVGEAYWTCRGKRSQKHYTVFVSWLSNESRANFTPHLNEEHREWRWIPAAEVALAACASQRELPLHPVVCRLFQMHPGVADHIGISGR